MQKDMKCYLRSGVVTEVQEDKCLIKPKGCACQAWGMQGEREKRQLSLEGHLERNLWHKRWA